MKNISSKMYIHLTSLASSQTRWAILERENELFKTFNISEFALPINRLLTCNLTGVVNENTGLGNNTHHRFTELLCNTNIE